MRGSWTLAKSGGLLALLRCVCRGLGVGREDILLCVQIIRGQHKRCSVWNRLFSKAKGIAVPWRGGSVRAQMGSQNHCVQWAWLASSQVSRIHPAGLVASSWVYTPRTAACGMVSLLVPEHTRLQPQLLFTFYLVWPLWWHPCYRKITVANFKSKLLITNISAGTWIKEITT